MNRIFIREENRNLGCNGNGFEVLTINEEDIRKGYQFGDDYQYSVTKDNIKDLTEYSEISGKIKDIEYLKEHIVFNSNDVGVEKWFCKMIDDCSYKQINLEDIVNNYNKFKDDDEIEVTIDMLNTQLEIVLKLDVASNWVDTAEYYTYWDGSNHQTIWLSGSDGYDSEWEEVTGDEDYQVVETLDSKNCGSYEKKIIQVKSGKKYIVESSFYQGSISDVWEETDLKEFE